MAISRSSLSEEIEKSIRIFEGAALPKWYFVLDLLKRSQEYSDGEIEACLKRLSPKYLEVLGQEAMVYQAYKEYLVTSSVEQLDLTPQMRRIDEIYRRLS